MSVINNAKLCNELVNTLRSISKRVNIDNLDPAIKMEARSIFKNIRPKSMTLYQALRNDEFDAIEDEWKMVKTMRENIEDSLDSELVSNLTVFEENYLDVTNEDLDPVADNSLGDDDVISESQLNDLEVAVPVS